MNAPQLLILFFYFIGLGAVGTRHGEPEPGKISVWIYLCKYSALLIVLLLGGFFAEPAHADVPANALRHRATLARTAQAEWGLNAPVATFAAQIHQESTWRETITAPDDGRGLAQFMDSTSGWLVKRYPALGKADPYNPAWAMRALVRYDRHLYGQVKGATECERMGAALKSYNAGLGYVLRAQAVSDRPEVWFGVTEHIKTGQSAKNFEYSRLYPHWIIDRYQPRYVAAGFGKGVCA